MENTSNISSEEQLSQLRNEGKISEAEYGELLETLRKTDRLDTEPVAQDQSAPARTSGMAIASLVFALALGPIGSIPAVICGHTALRKIEKNSTLKGRGLALAGLILGYTIFGFSLVLIIPVLAWRTAAIGQSATFEVLEVKRFPLDDTEGLLTKTNVQIDKQISSDGNGSLRIQATEPGTVLLFETGDMKVENSRLIYQAKIRTENVDGKVYLEMLCRFPGRGEFFSRGITTALTGTTDWTTQETPFFLKKGENPDNVKLNIVFTGKGTCWIDDIRLLKGPLK